MNRDQERAARAFDAVNDLDREVIRSEFLSLARDLPMMFHRNGLLATWAFLLSDQTKPQRRAALAACRDHLGARFPDRVGTDETTTFRRWVGAGNADALEGVQLRELTAEAIAYAGWLKRAAESTLGGTGAVAGEAEVEDDAAGTTAGEPEPEPGTEDGDAGEEGEA